MKLDPKETTLAYRCPACGKAVVSVTGVFALSGDMIRLKCGCDGSALTIKNESADKVRLTVPCLFCPNPHSFLISKKLLLERELFSFPCAYSGVDICFSGSKGAVLQALEKSEKEIADIVDDTELARIYEENEKGDEALYNDEHIRDLILFTLGELCEEKKIECGCERGKGDFLVENEIGKVRISCKNCGRAREFFCEENLETRTLFDADKITLSPEK